MTASVRYVDPICEPCIDPVDCLGIPTTRIQTGIEVLYDYIGTARGCDLSEEAVVFIDPGWIVLGPWESVELGWLLIVGGGPEEDHRRTGGSQRIHCSHDRRLLFVVKHRLAQMDPSSIEPLVPHLVLTVFEYHDVGMERLDIGSPPCGSICTRDVLHTASPPLELTDDRPVQHCHALHQAAPKDSVGVEGHAVVCGIGNEPKGEEACLRVAHEQYPDRAKRACRNGLCVSASGVAGRGTGRR